MSLKRARLVLLAAFIISLLVHLAFALLSHWSFAQPRAPKITIANLARVTIVKRRNPPSPHVLPRAPKPAPRQPRAAPTSSARRSLARGKPAVPGTAVAPGPSVAFVSTPSPQPIAPPSPGACDAPDAPSVVASTPNPPDIAIDARDAGTSGTTRVDVQLDPKGNVTGATVVTSSGNSSLDQVAVAMARDATYTPKLLNCKGVAGDYIFSVKFVAW